MPWNTKTGEGVIKKIQGGGGGLIGAGTAEYRGDEGRGGIFLGSGDAQASQKCAKGRQEEDDND